MKKTKELHSSPNFKNTKQFTSFTKINDSLLPAAEFQPITFVPFAFDKDWGICFRKILFFHQLCYFLVLKNFRKSLSIKVEQAFSRKKIIWYAFYNKFANLTNSVKFQVFFETKFKKRT